MHFTSLFALSQILAFATALLVPSQPVEDTVWDLSKGSRATVSWRNNDTAPPTLRATGALRISLWTGGIQQQTFLQELATNASATGRRANVDIDPTVGPTGHYYFLRFSSDAMSSDVFSARFTLQGMTGRFNSTVQGQLDSLSPSGSGAASGSVTLTSALTTSIVATSSSSAASLAAVSASSSSSARTEKLSFQTIILASLLTAVFFSLQFAI